MAGGGGTESSMPAGIATLGGGGGTRLIFVYEGLCLRLCFFPEETDACAESPQSASPEKASENKARKAAVNTDIGRLTFIFESIIPQSGKFNQSLLHYFYQEVLNVFSVN